jgi:GNAT superfamily N-acetyltransferase
MADRMLRDRHDAAATAVATPTGPPARTSIARPPLTPGRLAALWRSEGVKGLWFRSLARIGYRRWDCFGRSLDRPEPYRETGPDVEITILEPDDAGAYLSLRPEATLAEYRERLRAGRVCWAARHGNRLVAVKWVRFDVIEVPYLSRPYPLAPGEIYLEDMFTAPDMRGRHLQSAISARIFAHCRVQGYERTIGLVSPANAASIASIVRTGGYRRIGWVSRLHLGPVRWERFQRQPAMPTPTA